MVYSTGVVNETSDCRTQEKRDHSTEMQWKENLATGYSFGVVICWECSFPPLEFLDSGTTETVISYDLIRSRQREGIEIDHTSRLCSSAQLLRKTNETEQEYYKQHQPSVPDCLTTVHYNNRTHSFGRGRYVIGRGDWSSGSSKLWAAGPDEIGGPDVGVGWSWYGSASVVPRMP